MNNIKNEIDSKLASLKISEDMISNIKQGKKSIKNVNYKTALLSVFAMVIFIPIVYAAVNQFGITVNNEQLPPLDDMKIIFVNNVQADKIEYNIQRKRFSSINKLEDELGLEFLSSHLANKDYHIVDYEKIGEGYVNVNVLAYIIGDLTDIVYQDEYDYYSWKNGNDFQTPINLRMEVITDESQQFFDSEYLGTYKYIKSFTSSNGYKVNMLESEAKGKNELCAIFVANGIRYTLSGNIDSDLMIDIVDSMK